MVLLIGSDGESERARDVLKTEICSVVNEIKEMETGKRKEGDSGRGER